VTEAATVVHKMQSQPDAAKLLDQAQGVFILPDYGRAAVGVGGAGGQGVLLAKQYGRWTGPVFYNVGSISLGRQDGLLEVLGRS
jgi:lipid-binding SYLF domain-containing protein